MITADRFRERIPVLDSLRGAAILAVFAYHAFFWSGMRTDWWLARGIALVTRPGWLGVDLFFVLSGFLITGRLLDHRHLSAPDFYRWFYTRRALRILPLCYVTLVVVGSAMRWAGETSLSFLVVSALFMPNIALLAGVATTFPLAVLWSLGILHGFAWGGLLSILIRDVRFHGRRLSALGGALEGPMRPRRAGAMLRYVGRISYCLYLVHQFAFWSFDRIVSASPSRPLGPILVRAVVVLAVSTAIAELSWRYLEAPTLALRPAAA